MSLGDLNDDIEAFQRERQRVALEIQASRLAVEAKLEPDLGELRAAMMEAGVRPELGITVRDDERVICLSIDSRIVVTWDGLYERSVPRWAKRLTRSDRRRLQLRRRDSYLPLYDRLSPTVAPYSNVREDPNAPPYLSYAEGDLVLWLPSAGGEHITVNARWYLAHLVKQYEEQARTPGA